MIQTSMLEPAPRRRVVATARRKVVASGDRRRVRRNQHRRRDSALTGMHAFHRFHPLAPTEGTTYEWASFANDDLAGDCTTLAKPEDDLFLHRTLRLPGMLDRIPRMVGSLPALTHDRASHGPFGSTSLSGWSAHSATVNMRRWFPRSRSAATLCGTGGG